jgi:hypothetical protein
LIAIVRLHHSDVIIVYFAPIVSTEDRRLVNSSSANVASVLVQST